MTKSNYARDSAPALSTVSLLKLFQFGQSVLDQLKVFSCMALFLVMGFGTVGSILYLLYLGFL